MSTSAVDIQNLAINTIRTLSMDAVQAANSGHPGTPMALAPVAYALWSDHLNYDPANPNWPGRDRFVLSCGHASMLLYSLIHLAQVAQTDEQGKPTSGRQSQSKTSKTSANWKALALVIQNSATPPASRQPRGHWARDWATVSVWQSPPNGWLLRMIVRSMNYLVSTLMHYAATVTSWRASLAKPPRWPGT